MSTSYPTDLTDEQWELLSVLIPRENTGCRPRCVDIRGVWLVQSFIFFVRVVHGVCCPMTIPNGKRFTIEQRLRNLTAYP
ncbi:MAG: hypothetical protein QNJ51_08740 [Calothrix sp. MO_167.B12]|nr:hypothetical protein [Calothrix sp. MO_167.B12]